MGSILAIGADPGEHGALALVRCSHGQRPELVHAWRRGGDRLGLWLHRAHGAAVEARSLVGAAPEIVAWIEEVPCFGRAQIAAGIARRQGVLISALLVAGLPEPERKFPQEWWAQWKGGIRQGGKDPATKGAHRLVEACRLVVGAEAMLAEDPSIDLAEAILIAGAAGFWKLGQMSQVSMNLKCRKARKNK